MADAFREALVEASRAVSDLEAALGAERCMVEIQYTTGPDLKLIWARHGKSRAWRILGAWDGREAPLLELPALARVAAYSHLDKFGAEVRAATAEKLRAAGLLGGDRE